MPRKRRDAVRTAATKQYRLERIDSPLMQNVNHPSAHAPAERQSRSRRREKVRTKRKRLAARRLFRGSSTVIQSACLVFKIKMSSVVKVAASRRENIK